MEQARLQTELESLGREVDPHFLFNNLNALAHLVEQRSDAAPGFIRALSATYRYVLDCRGRPLVPVADEIEALERYQALADLRYARAVHLEIDVPDTEARRLFVPPVALSELFHNALKHNTITPDRPLHIRVSLHGLTLVFENDLRLHPAAAPSTGIGLANLRERFRIATGRPATWGIDGERFVARLPLVRNVAVSEVELGSDG